MRIDQFLKLSRVVKRRTQAKEMCEEGVVKVNGAQVKASKEVKEGDVVEIDTITRYVKFQVLKVPKKKSVSKEEAKSLIKILEDRKKDVREIIDLI